MTELVLESCGQIDDLSDLGGLTGLQYLNVSEAGSLRSLQPIAGLRGLKGLQFYGCTKIADGDLTPLLSMTHLTDLRMMNRRHYTPSLAEVKAALGITA